MRTPSSFQLLYRYQLASSRDLDELRDGQSDQIWHCSEWHFRARPRPHQVKAGRGFLNKCQPRFLYILSIAYPETYQIPTKHFIEQVNGQWCNAFPDVRGAFNF